MIQMTLKLAAEAMCAKCPDTDLTFRGVSIDSRTCGKDELFFAIHGERFDGHDFLNQAASAGVAAVVSERPVALSVPVLLVEDTQVALADLARAWRNRQAVRLVAVTGSNGKTTVKEMVASVLSTQGQVHKTRGNLNNEFGVPLTLFGLNADHEFAVVEMGANHVGEIERLASIARPDIAIITMAGAAHIGEFGGKAQIAKAKGEIFSGLSKDGWAIINQDDAYADYWKSLVSGRVITFGEAKSADVKFTVPQLIQGKGTRISQRFTLEIKNDSIGIELPLLGEHNVRNACVAAAVDHLCGISLESIKQGLESTTPVKGRLQPLRGKLGQILIDDTYNASPDSVTASLTTLAAFQGPKYLLLGDMAELGSHSDVAHREIGIRARSLGIDGLLAVGDASRETVAAFGEGGQHFPNHEALLNCFLTLYTPSSTTLVKGSRRMGMERVVEALYAQGKNKNTAPGGQ